MHFLQKNVSNFFFVILSSFFAHNLFTNFQYHKTIKNNPFTPYQTKNTHNRINWKIIKLNKSKYGIYIVKTEYKSENIKTEDKEIKYLTNDEQKVEEVLDFFKRHEVTPIIAEDVIEDLKYQLF